MLSSAECILWSDVDGVLLDWYTPFLKFMCPNIDPKSIVSYDLSKYIPDAEEKIQFFNNSINYEILQPLVDPDLLVHLREKLLGWKINLLTKVTPTQMSCDARKKNIIDRFGSEFADMLYMVDDSKNKLSRIQKVNPDGINLVIEDHPGTIKQMQDAGIVCFGIRQHYNQEEFKSLDCLQYDTTEEAILDIIRKVTHEQ